MANNPNFTLPIDEKDIKSDMTYLNPKQIPCAGVNVQSGAICVYIACNKEPSLHTSKWYKTYGYAIVMLCTLESLNDKWYKIRCIFYLLLWLLTSWTKVAFNQSEREGVGVTKPISSVPLFSNFFRVIKTHVTYWISRLYLSGVVAAQLRWHLSNINVIRII